jgi:hypothetical protein
MLNNASWFFNLVAYLKITSESGRLLYRAMLLSAQQEAPKPANVS